MAEDTALTKREPGTGLAELARRLLQARAVLLTTHAGPDGDGIGSVAALGRALRQHGYRVTALLADPVPERYAFIPGTEEILALPTAREALRSEDWEFVVVLDTHQWTMLGEMEEWIKERGLPCYFLDHHPQTGPPRPEVVSDPEAAATGEIVYRLLRDHLAWPISPDVAESLYVSIAFDTNSFKYIRSNPSCLLIAAELVKLGVDTNRIYRHLFASNSRRKARLLGAVLSTVDFECDGRIAYVLIPHTLVRELGLERDELRDSITHILEIHGVEVAATLKEMEPDDVKVSLRSKGLCAINGVASRMGGGGHALAAGYDYKGTVQAAWDALRGPLVELLDRGDPVPSLTRSSS